VGILNEGLTWYTNGCTDPPGQKTFSELTRQPNGQWSGNSITITSDCATHRYSPIGAMRLIRGASGHPTLLVAWNTAVGGGPPTIEPDGTVVTPYAFYEMRLDRRGAGTSGFTAEEDPPLTEGGRAGDDRAGATGLSIPAGAVLRPASP
jgi:hypothetical protein